MPAAISTARLEARISTDLHSMLKRAAELQGRTMTDFVVAAVGNHGAFDGGASKEGSADLYRLAFAYHEDLVKGNFCANVCRYLFYFKF